MDDDDNFPNGHVSPYGPTDNWPTMSSDTDAIQIVLGVPKGALLPSDLPELTERLQLAAFNIVNDIVRDR